MPDWSALSVVLAWQESVNNSDIDNLLSLSDPNIEIVGPRGSAYGHHVLGEWLKRAGLTLKSSRYFARGDTVVAEQHGTWRSTETGEVVGEKDVASLFKVEGEVVKFYARYDNLGEALEEAGLSLADEVSGC